MSIFSKLSKKTKNLLFTLGAILSVVLVFAGLILTDYAKKPFWWTFWDIVWPLGIATFVGLVVWKNKQKEYPEQEDK